MTSGRRRSVDRHVAPADLDAAIRAARSHGRAARLQRLCFVKNCYAGDSATEAAGRVGVSRTTGARWLDRWNAEGLSGLEPAERSGRPPKLAGEDREAAREVLIGAAPLSTAAAGELLRERVGVEYAEGYLPRLLRSLGFRYADPDDVAETGGEGDRRATEGERRTAEDDRRTAEGDGEIGTDTEATARHGLGSGEPVLVPVDDGE